MTGAGGLRGRLAAIALVAAVGLLDVLLRAGGHASAPVAADAGLPAIGPSALPAISPSVTPSRHPRPRTPVRIVTGPAGRDVHGVVVDEANRRLAGVHVAYDESLPDAPSFRPVAVTDAAGRFSVPCESRSIAPTLPPLLLSAYDGASGLVDPAAPDVAWVEIAQQCGSTSGPSTSDPSTSRLGVRLVMSRGAVLQGTLFQHGQPANRAGLRVGLACDGMPRGNINAFVAQVAAAVSPSDGRFRLTGMRTDRCAVGVFDQPARGGREVVLQVDVTAGRTTHLDVHDDGQDHFPGRGGGGSTPSPTPSPSATCLALCPRDDVPDGRRAR